MEQYFVLVLTRVGESWVGHSGDFPHLRIKGSSPEQIYSEAAHAIRMEVHKLRSAGRPLPRFRSYADVRVDDTFARERGIHWTSAIVRMIPLPPLLQTIVNPAPEPALDGTSNAATPVRAPLPRAS